MPRTPAAECGRRRRRRTLPPPPVASTARAPSAVDPCAPSDKHWRGSGRAQPPAQRPGRQGPGRWPGAPLPLRLLLQAEGGARPSGEEEAPPPAFVPGIACPFSSARTRPFARGLACARADGPCGTEIQVRRMVGLPAASAMLTARGVDGGGGGGAARAGSWISQASLEKR